jgi:glycosyltransferase involved in cell wall biosynthesis
MNQKSKLIKYSVVIPCYNEENAISLTVNEITRILSQREDFEIIVVDDGSSDNTPEYLIELTRQVKQLRVISHEINRGYGASLKTGINHARGKYVAITDADGSYPNEQLLVLFDEIGGDYDMVVGARVGKNVVYPLIRKIPKVFLKRYTSWLTGVNIPDINSGLRVFRKSTCQKFLHVLPNGFSFTTTITMALLTNNYLVKYLPIDYKPRIGKSKIRPIRDTLNFLQLILRTGMYFAPLRVFLPLAGMIFTGAIASIIYDTLYLNNLTDKSVILLMFGLNTCMFALLADMIDKRN